MTKQETAYLILGSSGIVLVGMMGNIAASYPHYALRAGIVIGLVISIFVYIGIMQLVNVMQAMVDELAEEIVKNIYARQYDPQNR